MKKPIQILRERRGGAPKDLIARSREQKKILGRLRDALQGGSRTVPEISSATGLDSRLVLFYVMAMKKYGEVVEGEERDSYFEYALKEKEA